jgi:hypothetical protein
VPHPPDPGASAGPAEAGATMEHVEPARLTAVCVVHEIIPNPGETPT